MCHLPFIQVIEMLLEWNSYSSLKLSAFDRISGNEDMTVVTYDDKVDDNNMNMTIFVYFLVSAYNENT